MAKPFNFDDYPDAPSSGTAPAAKAFNFDAYPDVHTTPQTGINWDTFGKNAKALVSGTGIGEALPVIGDPIRRAGTAVGSAVGAGIESLGSDQSYSDLYKQRQDRAEAEHQKDLAIDRAGPVGSLVKTAGAGLAIPMPKAAMTERYIPEMASKAGQFGKWLAGTGERAAYQGGISGADTLSRGGSTDEALDSAKWGAMLSGGFDAAPKIAEGVGKTYSKVVAQIPGKDLAYYRANRPNVQSIDPQASYEEMSAAGREMKKKGELVGEQAGRGEAEAIRQAEAETSLKRNQYAATAARERSEGMGQARELKEGVAKSEAQDLAESENVRRTLGEGIAGLPFKARKAISESSQEATRLAEESGKEVKIAPYKAIATRELNKLKASAADKGGAQAKAVQEWLDRLNGLEVKVLPVAKFRLLTQGLDDMIEGYYALAEKGQRIGPGGRALMGVRKAQSEKMKKIIPGYRDQMDKTSGLVRPLKEFENHFSTDPDAMYRITNDIHSPGRENRLGALEAADTAFDGGLKPSLDELKAIRSRDYSPQLEQAKSIEGRDYEGNYELPNLFVEAEKGRKIGEASEKFRPEYARGKDIADLSKGLGKDENARAFMEKYGRKPEQFNDRRKQMEAIALEEGKPINYYTEKARNAYVKRAMTGGQIQGSRLTKLGAEAGGALAEASGMHSGSKIMAFLGSSAGAISDVVGKDVVRKLVDAIDSPRGQRFAQIYREAAKRGPQAIAMTHAMLMKKDPEYQAMMDENFKKKMSEGGDPSARSEPEAGLESEGFFDVVKPYKQALLKKSGMPEWAQDTADFLLPDDAMGLVDIAKLGKKGGTAISKVFENNIQKSPRNISNAGKALGSRAVKVGDEIYSHKIFKRNGKIQHVLVNASGEPVAEIQGNLINYNGEKGFAIDWSHSNTSGKGDGKKLYDLVLDTHNKIFSDTSLSPEGSHKVYADHFTKKPGVSVDLAEWETPNRHQVTLNDSKEFKKSLGAKVVPKNTRDYFDKFDPEVDEVVESSANRAIRRSEAEAREFKNDMERYEAQIARGGNLDAIRRNVNRTIPERFRATALARVDQAANDIAKGNFPQLAYARAGRMPSDNDLDNIYRMIDSSDSTVVAAGRKELARLMNDSNFDHSDDVRQMARNAWRRGETHWKGISAKIDNYETEEFVNLASHALEGGHGLKRVANFYKELWDEYEGKIPDSRLQELFFNTTALGSLRTAAMNSSEGMKRILKEIEKQVAQKAGTGLPVK